MMVGTERSPLVSFAPPAGRRCRQADEGPKQALTKGYRYVEHDEGAGQVEAGSRALDGECAGARGWAERCADPG
ncbi:hypothetical protein CO657_13805 [Rhizobium acidisoli]|uniref:Uncharacterized protein n=1 Tax=Rhizobium acidisoli TaxID=1538158 RepID=A0AAE5TYV6_9HYPH|nr:hypothetical protein CO657_13805 [Rhizobium acidisoli]